MPTSGTKVSSDIKKRIGIVVIGRNEGDRLAACLQRALSLVSFVVYADSDSSDGSAALAQRLGAGVVALTNDEPLTAARGRAAGFDQLLRAHPAADLVQFVDGDCILELDWLEKGVSFLDRHPGVALVCGRRFESFPSGSFYNRLIDAEWNTPVGEAESCGGDSLMRVAAVRQAGPFRADLIAGEEPELCTRLRAAGWTIWRLDTLMTEHDANIMRFSQWWRRAQRGGAGYAQVWSITRRIGRPLYGRQMMSALFWAGVVPLAASVAAIVAGSAAYLIIFPAVVLVQTVRIAWRGRRLGFRHAVGAALIQMSVKPAEAIGIAHYALFGARHQATSYRQSARPNGAARTAA